MFCILLQNLGQRSEIFLSIVIVINNFGLAPEMILKIDFKILCLQLKI